jgi:hypothetical protein
MIRQQEEYDQGNRRIGNNPKTIDGAIGNPKVIVSMKTALELPEIKLPKIYGMTSNSGELLTG